MKAVRHGCGILWVYSHILYEKSIAKKHILNESDKYRHKHLKQPFDNMSRC